MANITKKFTKPTLRFPLFPTIYMYIDSEYNKVKTYSDFVGFIHKCLTESEVSTNEIRQIAYRSVGGALYSMETNRSYESMDMQILANS